MNCLLLFILLWISSINVTVLSMSQDVMNSILHQILDNDESYHQKWKKTEITPFTAIAKSSIERVCDRMTGKNEEDRQRVACCTPLETRVYRNVMIQKNTLHTYSLTSHEHSTPEVNNVKYQQVSSFTMKFFHHPSESFDPSRCTSFYNGTLHVFPKVTTHNVYHAVSDNVMPLVSQILLDSVLDQDFLYLPRKYLAYDHQAAPYKLGRNGGEALHLSLIEELMSDGSIRLDQTEGTCYRRIVWGPGPHIFFVDSLQALRRKSTQFLRLMTQHILQPYPYYTWPAINPSNSLNPLLKNPTTGEPLKVIVYTRGNTGRGRTMKNEELLVNQLKQYGANVFYCCNFDKVNITQQLYYAYEADVITGLHGAAIVHGLFMKPGAITIEWKTLYAYESILFGIIADSRGGIHAQIDIRKYFKPGGHHPMDHALVTRIMQAIHSGKQLQTQLFLETNNGDNMRQNDVSKVPCFPTPRIESVVNSSLPGDFIFAAHCTPHSIDHLLGPTRPVHAEMCGTTSFLHQIYKKVGKEAMNPIHCPICSRFSR